MLVQMSGNLDSDAVRSKKIREIIDNDPPWFIQYGTTCITFIIVVVVLYIFLNCRQEYN